uniref:Secreted protein n=1 Tax=Maylandia zebra TaxID=106582 RepID=A0A3P9C8C9_9CICH
MSTWLSLLWIRAVVWLKDSNAFSLYHCNVTFTLLDNTMCRQTNCQIYIVNTDRHSICCHVSCCNSNSLLILVMQETFFVLP